MEGKWGNIIVSAIITAVIGVVVTAFLSPILSNKSPQSTPSQNYVEPSPSPSESGGEGSSSDDSTDDKTVPQSKSVFLSDMESFYASNGDFFKYDSALDNLGNSHRKVLCYWSQTEITYKLNGEFSKLEGCLFQFEDEKNSDWTTSMEIYLDGQSICYEQMRGGIEPIDINLELTDVQELTIEWHSCNMETYAGLGDCILYYK